MEESANNRVLIAITSYNQIEYTRKCFESLSHYKGSLLCVDDCSDEPIEELCKEFGVRLERNEVGKGLTNLWNNAYKIFKFEGYDYLLISNNDVLFPKGSIEAIVETLREHPYVGVLTREGEPWEFAKAQAVERFYDIDSDFVDEPSNYQKVQDQIQRSPLPPQELVLVYGFCFGVNRSIIPCEFDTERLFDPQNKNVGQESEFAGRAPSKTLCRSAFVYHFKGRSFGRLPSFAKDRRENISLYRKEFRWKLWIRYAVDYARYLKCSLLRKRD